MKAPQQTGTDQPTPEQLMQLLELQLAQERGKRAGRSRNRATILVFGMLAILVVAGVALMIAQQMLFDLHERGTMGRTTPESATVVEKL